MDLVHSHEKREEKQYSNLLSKTIPRVEAESSRVAASFDMKVL